MCIHIGQETTMTLLLSGKLWAPHNSYTTLVEANIRSIHCHRSLTKEEKEAVRQLKESLDLAHEYPRLKEYFWCRKSQIQDLPLHGFPGKQSHRHVSSEPSQLRQ